MVSVSLSEQRWGSVQVRVGDENSKPETWESQGSGERRGRVAQISECHLKYSSGDASVLHGG